MRKCLLHLLVLGSMAIGGPLLAEPPGFENMKWGSPLPAEGIQRKESGVGIHVVMPPQGFFGKARVDRVEYLFIEKRMVGAVLFLRDYDGFLAAKRECTEQYQTSAESRKESLAEKACRWRGPSTAANLYFISMERRPVLFLWGAGALEAEGGAEFTLEEWQLWHRLYLTQLLIEVIEKEIQIWGEKEKEEKLRGRIPGSAGRDLSVMQRDFLGSERADPAGVQKTKQKELTRLREEHARLQGELGAMRTQRVAENGATPAAVEPVPPQL